MNELSNSVGVFSPVAFFLSSFVRSFLILTSQPSIHSRLFSRYIFYLLLAIVFAVCKHTLTHSHANSTHNVFIKLNNAWSRCWKFPKNNKNAHISHKRFLLVRISILNSPRERRMDRKKRRSEQNQAHETLSDSKIISTKKKEHTHTHFDAINARWFPSIYHLPIAMEPRWSV